MPVHPTYPGVYVEEIPSGLHTVSGVATSVAAFIGTFKRGPLNAAMRILSPADFEREYGGLDRNSEATYGVQQFFLNGGQEAWIVRVADTVSTGANDIAAAEAAAVLVDETSPTPRNIVRVRAARRVRGKIFSNTGTWGNFIRVDIDYKTADPATLFNMTISEVRIDGVRTSVVQTENFLNLTMEPNTANNAIEIVNQGSRLVQLERDAGWAAIPVPAPGKAFDATFRPALNNSTIGGKLSTSPNPADIPADDTAFEIKLVSNGVTYQTTGGTIDYGPGIVVLPTTFEAVRPYIEAAIRRAPTVSPSIFAAGTDPELPTGLRPLLTNASVEFVGDTSGPRFRVRLGGGAKPYDPDATITFSGAAATLLKLDTAVAQPVEFKLVGGSDGNPTATGTTFWPVPVEFFRGDPLNKTGLYALEDVDLFNILCIPEATTLSSTEMQSLYSEAEVYVEKRRAMLIVDISTAQNSLDGMQTWMDDNDGLRHPNAAVYFPRTNISDPLNRGRLRSIPSSGTIAGLWARTDAQRGVWKAPAGTDARLQNVSSLPYVMTDLENGTLNPLGVNCLRSFPVYSNICWGARTLDGADVLASDWKYVPVRRTTLFLEESLFRGTKWAVFEPNDEPLWAQIRLNIGSFMQDLFRKGAFQGTTPQKAFFVKCDGETTTQQDIDSGIVNIEVGFAPLKPAEFVILKIRQIIPTAAG